ncbi:MAG: sulfatase-like hydrolase/transferase [Halobacteriales archaeon]|nr:sulfatase-like hydrolase/transferase [Halobacteriales archaeon]
MTRWRAVGLVGLLLLAAGCAAVPPQDHAPPGNATGPAPPPAQPLPPFPPRSPGDTRPNFLVIVSDDQRYDTMWAMPRTNASLFERGIAFDHGYVTTPLCCPSRSSILTGLYAFHHGVNENYVNLTLPTFVQALHGAGYTTGLVGKYLNSWGGEPRPEFDSWVATHGGGVTFTNPTMNIEGTWTKLQGHGTVIEDAYALRFLDRASNGSKPFLLLFAPNAPHNPATPEPADAQRYADLPPARPPSYDAPGDPTDPPPLARARAAEIDAFRLDQLRSLAGLDRAVGDILDKLEARGLAGNTVVFYLSDNGYLSGEHRLEEKRQPYEESIRVPFAMRVPGVAPRVDERLVANIDIAPTILAMAGLPHPDMDGAPLSGPADGPGREDLVIEGVLRSGAMWAGLHTDRWVYVRWNLTGGRTSEALFDLWADPFELHSLAGTPEAADVQARLAARLAELRPVEPARPQVTDPNE